MRILDAYRYSAGIIAVVVGSYMAFRYSGKSLPPTLSGVAFVAIGAVLIVEAYMSEHL